MIGSMRENLKHLKWVIWAVVGAFMVSIFAFWGGGAQRGEGIAADWAATVGDEVITVIEFKNAYRMSEYRYREALYGMEKEFNPAEMNLGYRIINDMITERLLAAEAKKLGFRASDAELADAIMESPNFQRDGRFVGRDEYIRALSRQGLSAAVWENQVRWYLLADKMRDLLRSAVTITEKQIEERFHDTLRRVNLLYFFVPEDALPRDIAVSQADIKAYYEKNKESYTVPEERRVEYTVFDPEDYHARVKVTEEELRDYYERAKEFYHVSGERWRASHVLIRLEELADDEAREEKRILAESIADRARKGEDFAALARQYSEDPGSAVKGGDLGYFGPGRMVEPFEDAVKALEKGGVSDVVTTSFGFHIIKLQDFDPGGYYRTYEEVEPELREQFIEQRASSIAYDDAKELSQTLQAETFRETAQELGADIRDSGFFSRRQEGAFPEPLQELQRRSYFLSLHDISSPIAIGDRYAVFYVAERRENRVPDFDEVKDGIRKDVQDTRRETTYIKWAEKELAGVHSGKKSFDDFEKKFGREKDATGTFTRTNRPVRFEQKTPGLFEMVEPMEEGDVGAYYLPEKGLMLFKVDLKVDFEEDAYEKRKELLRDELIQIYQNEVIGAAVSTFRMRSEVRTNHKLVLDAQGGKSSVPAAS
jgi:peptidyl-prolyl cis-trans isomerase D